MTKLEICFEYKAQRNPLKACVTVSDQLARDYAGLRAWFYAMLPGTYILVVHHI